MAEDFIYPKPDRSIPNGAGAYFQSVWGEHSMLQLIRSIVAGEFSFNLMDEDGNVLQTKTNDENGKIVFDSIEYKDKGEYKYEIAEVIPDDAVRAKMTDEEDFRDELQAEEFSFSLKDSTGKVVAAAKNDENGLICFGEIYFTDPGTYTYTVTEDIGTDEHIIYDKTIKVVTVEVEETENSPVARIKSFDVTSKAANEDSSS